MSVAWLIFLILLLCGAIPLLRLLRAAPRLGVLLLLLAIATLASAYALNQRQIARATHEKVRGETMPLGDRGEGYVHSDSCVSCHPREHQTWFRSFHRTMTQVASPQTVIGKFDGAELEWAGAKYKMDRDAEGMFIEMDDPLWRARQRGVETVFTNAPRIKARPALLTGSHHMQVCWVSTGIGKTQILAPFAWLKDDQRWAPFDQTFLRDPARPPLPQYWNKSCVGCHTTAPVPLYDPSKGDVRTTAGELGIACEACHGPGEAHVAFHQNPLHRYSPRLTSSKPTAAEARLANPAKMDSKMSAAVCGQCHAVKWYRNGEKWNHEGARFNPGTDPVSFGDPIQPNQRANQEWPGYLRVEPTFLRDRYWEDGMVRVSGREYNGLLESPCYKNGELSCLSCHSMHKSEPDDQLAARMETNDACLQCHPKFRDNLAQHTHHPAASSGSLCYNCHMPFTTYGLLKGIRSHQISSPNIQVAHYTGRPDACTACHLDKSSGWAAQNLTKWFGQKAPELNADEKDLPASVMLALKGDAGQRALTAFAMGWSDAQKISRAEWLAPYLGQLLDDPYPAVRYIAHRSLRTLPQFKDFKFDFTIPPANREAVAPKITNTIAPNIDPQKFIQLLNARDNTSIDLQE